MAASYSGAVYLNGVHIRRDNIDAVLGNGKIKLRLYKGYHAAFTKHDGEPEIKIKGISELLDSKVLYYPGETYSVTDFWIDQETGKYGYSATASRITIWRIQEDNNYIYARIKTPCGDVWSGYSGYGVGDEFEGYNYGYRNKDRMRTLKKLLALDGYGAYKPSLLHVLAMHFGLEKIMPSIRRGLWLLKGGRFRCFWSETCDALDLYYMNISYRIKKIFKKKGDV